MKTDEEMRALLRKVVGKEISKWAKQHGCKRQNVFRAMYAEKGRFPVSIGRALGYELKWLSDNKQQ